MKLTFPVTVALGLIANGLAQDGKIYFEKITLHEGNASEGVSVGDFNNDGHLDASNGLYWWPGPDWKKKHRMGPTGNLDYPLNDYAYYYMPIRPLDINNDGWLDVPFQRGLKNGFWLENPGPGKQEGLWKEHTFSPIGGESAQVYPLFGGKADVLLSNNIPSGTTGPLTWSKYDTATKKWVYNRISATNYPHNHHGLGLGDITGNGRNDVLVYDGWFEQPAVVEKDVAWKFHPFKHKNPYQTSGYTGGSHMFAADFTGNGKADFVTSLNGHGWGLAWYEQVEENGGISFKQHIIMGDANEKSKYGLAFSQLHSLALVDINGDGLKDIVTGKRWAAKTSDPDSRGDAVIYWFEQRRTSSGTQFIPHLVDANSGSGLTLETVDMDGDGFPDIVTTNKKGTFIFLTRGHAKTGVAMPSPSLKYNRYGLFQPVMLYPHSADKTLGQERYNLTGRFGSPSRYSPGLYIEKVRSDGN